MAKFDSTCDSPLQIPAAVRGSQHRHTACCTLDRSPSAPIATTRLSMKSGAALNRFDENMWDGSRGQSARGAKGMGDLSRRLLDVESEMDGLRSRLARAARLAVRWWGGACAQTAAIEHEALAWCACLLRSSRPS